jgi:hypothetical protein
VYEIVGLIIFNYVPRGDVLSWLVNRHISQEKVWRCTVLVALYTAGEESVLFMGKQGNVTVIMNVYDPVSVLQAPLNKALSSITQEFQSKLAKYLLYINQDNN